jgi:pSer/pThr/pTyr-binding forkhead associated (FHA) protein
VRADRAWFEEVRRQDGVDAGALEFPRYAQERRFVLSGAQVTIGRRSASRGIEPDVDLTGQDPAVSSAHALLLARPDGGWDLVDVGSTNGTTLAVDDGPIPPHRPVPLAEGAVIRLGAWTTITLTADPPATA